VGFGLLSPKPNLRQDCCEKAMQVTARERFYDLLPDADGDSFSYKA
jgi:hypothetical protein